MHKGILCFIIALCGFHLVNAATTKNKAKVDDPKIYFPGELDNKFGSDDIPEECKGKNYCHIKPANYDQDRYDSFFNNTKNMEGPKLIIKPIITVDDKIDDDADDDCEVTVTYEPLYRIRSKRGDWHTVIQAPKKNYLQQVRMENCVSKDEPCFRGMGYIPEIETGCVQKYSVWEFYVDDGKGGMDKFSSSNPVITLDCLLDLHSSDGLKFSSCNPALDLIVKLGKCEPGGLIFYFKKNNTFEISVEEGTPSTIYT